MSTPAVVMFAVLLFPLLSGVYAYAGYPILLRVIRRVRPARTQQLFADSELPVITITLPAYNEAARLAGAIDAILAGGYPVDRRHILVISDASSDATDDIARG